MPCCVDVLKKLKIGSLKESTLRELWNGPAIQSIRTAHMKGQYGHFPLCEKCDEWWYPGKAPKK